MNLVGSANVPSKSGLSRIYLEFGPLRKLELYVKKYGTEAGKKLYHTLQSQAAHAGVSARLRKKLLVLTGQAPACDRPSEPMPLFAQADPGSVNEVTAPSYDTTGRDEVLPEENDATACYLHEYVDMESGINRAEPIPGSC